MTQVWEDFDRITALLFADADTRWGLIMSTSPVMRLLADGIPLSLLCDLVSTADPDSAAVNSVERPANDLIWMDAAETRKAWAQASSE